MLSFPLIRSDQVAFGSQEAVSRLGTLCALLAGRTERLGSVSRADVRGLTVTLTLLALLWTVAMVALLVRVVHYKVRDLAVAQWQMKVRCAAGQPAPSSPGGPPPP
jgi:class 3 adenylate cyclase